MKLRYNEPLSKIAYNFNLRRYKMVPMAKKALSRVSSSASMKAMQRNMSTTSLCDSEGGMGQGLTLVHFSAQHERFLWDRGCAEGLCSPC